MFAFVLVFHFLLDHICVEAACTWPENIANKTWIDSLKGDMVFGTSTMKGWPFEVQIQSQASVQRLDDWECVTYNETGPYLIMKTVDVFIQYVTHEFTGYRCIIPEKITDHSYRYYQTEAIQYQLDDERITIFPDSTLTDPATLCTHPSSGGEFQVMIEKGYEASAKVSCPYNLLSDYTFTYSKTDGAVSCNSAASDIGSINMCTNITEISVQPLSCSPYPLYTSGNSSWCVDVVTVGSDTFVSLYNGSRDSAVANTYQFVCVSINSGGSSLSVTPQHCKASQTSTEVPIDNSGAESGAVWSLNPSGDPCPPCTILSDPFRGSVTISTNGAITSATYVCDATYTLSGNETRICQGNGEWTNSEPSCACPIPSSFTNGKVEVKDAGLTVSFICDAGFVLIGTSTLSCDTVTNEWSDAYPSCDVCQTLNAPIDGSVTLTSDGLTTVAVYTCDVGTTLNGDSSRTCRTDTSWTNNEPTCTSCPGLADIASGNVTIRTDNTTTTATYICAPGYSINGVSTAQCTTSGTWDSNPPLCQCDDPLSPDNGTVTVSDDKNQAGYTCNIGFTFYGDDTRTCQTDGSGWSSADPVCVGCPALSEPGNGSVSLSTDGTKTVATYSCDIGYTLKGGIISDCQTDGSWSSLPPTCSFCDSVPNISSGSYTLISDGTTTSAKYSCSVGTTISGDAIIACDANGVWTISSGTTSCVECPVLSTSGGNFEISTDGTTTTAELVCESGYTLENGGSIECQSNGSWSYSLEGSQCVPTPSSSDSKENSDRLLPAVIVLSVIAVAIGIALGVALVYIWKLKKKKSGNFDEKKHRANDTNSFMPPSVPPRGDFQHIMDNRNISSALSAPMSFTSSPRSDSITPRSLSTSTSNSSLHLSHLNLIREDTTSSVILDQNHPAPWSNRSKPKYENGSNMGSKSSVFPPISENGALVTPRSEFNKVPHGHAKKKKLSFGKKIQRQNSIEANEPEVTNNTHAKANSSKSESKKSYLATNVSRFGKVTKTGGGLSNGGPAVPTLRPPEEIKRASTPVKHQLEIKEPTECSTPRSNRFTTVQ